MTTQEFNAQLQRDNHIAAGSPAHEFMHKAADEARKTTALINGAYRTDEELRALMSRLVGYRVDDGFRLFPPVYTDFGKNIKIGKDKHQDRQRRLCQLGVLLSRSRRRHARRRLPRRAQCRLCDARPRQAPRKERGHDRRAHRRRQRRVDRRARDHLERGDDRGRRDRRRRRGRDKGRAAKYDSSRGAGACRQNDLKRSEETCERSLRLRMYQKITKFIQIDKMKFS